MSSSLDDPTLKMLNFPRANLRSSRFRSIQIGILVPILILFATIFTPAQGISDRAAVTVDSRQIFQVANSAQLKASERRDSINTQLQAAVESQQPPTVKLELRNKAPTIIVNDRYLLTVTQNDTIDGQTTTEQATIWINQLQAAILQAQQERSPEFIKQMVVLALGVIVVAIALHWLFGKIWQRVSLSVTKLQAISTDGEPQSINLLFRSTLFLVRTAMWTIALLYITNLFPLTRQWSYNFTNSLISSLTSPIFSRGTMSYSITSLVILLGFLIGTIVLSGVVTNILRTRILQAMRLSRGAEASISILVKYALITIGSIVLLQLWGLDLSSLTILASALGIGLGFGFQNIAKDFGSGLILLFERPIQVGDFVEVNDYKGTVEQINARSTVIRTLDRISIILPNSHFLDREVINWSHLNPTSRLHLPVGVAYGSDANLVRSTLIEAIRTHPEVLSSPPPHVLFKGFGDSALDFELLVWITTPERQLLIKSDLYFLIEAAFQQHQIEIPFPQQDVHFRSGSLPIQLSPELEQAILAFSKNVDRHRS
ncbi:MAG: mechanosensitive ion channel [Chamaesiphon sp.]|nr:mechanosensitive ion channel [Chamaesiphon sp.]